MSDPLRAECFVSHVVTRMKSVFYWSEVAVENPNNVVSEEEKCLLTVLFRSANRTTVLLQLQMCRREHSSVGRMEFLRFTRRVSANESARRRMELYSLKQRI